MMLDKKTLADLAPNRYGAFPASNDTPSARQRRRRLLRELAKLSPLEEKQLAEEGLDRSRRG